jgi:hypothetical protein
MDLHSGAAFWLVSNGWLPRRPGSAVGSIVMSSSLAPASPGRSSPMRCRPMVWMSSCWTAGSRPGSTAASTALLLFEIDVELADLAQRIGEAAAVRCYRLGLEAIDALERLSRELGDCGFASRPSLYLASRGGIGSRCVEEADLRQRHDLPSEFWTRAEVAAAIRSPVTGRSGPTPRPRLIPWHSRDACWLARQQEAPGCMLARRCGPMRSGKTESW